MREKSKNSIVAAVFAVIVFGLSVTLRQFSAYANISPPVKTFTSMLLPSGHSRKICICPANITPIREGFSPANNIDSPLLKSFYSAPIANAP